MIRAWRLCLADRAEDVWTGTGGLHRGGRWHHRSRPIIYTASSVALAQLEALAHVSRRTVPELSLAVAEIPDSVPMIQIGVRALPVGWDRHPAIAATADFGDRWLTENESGVLRVPSVMSPEPNYLLNPRHPDFPKITLGAPEPFAMNRRLFRRGS